MNLLVLCTGNSCRPQWPKVGQKNFTSNFYSHLNFTVQSAGLETLGLDLRAVRAMQAHDIDISHQTSNARLLSC